MSIYELIKTNESLLRLLSANGAKASDVEYISMYERYVDMRNSGEKKQYVISKLSEQYGVSYMTAYRVIRKMAESARIKF